MKEETNKMIKKQIFKAIRCINITIYRLKGGCEFWCDKLSQSFVQNL